VGEGEALAPALTRRYVRVMFSLSLLALAIQAASPAPAAERVASGTFTVTVTPELGGTAPIGALRLAKTYTGELQATAAGRMLASGDPASGSAGYVALERVTGTLDGRAGSFDLQHSGWMHAGQQVMEVRVVPGSATGDLKGLTGTMTIAIDGREHRYRLSYRLP
jgi:expansin (peptidoglycan-binding protein)